MKYITMFLITFLHLTVSGQPSDAQSRKRELEQCTEQVYSVSEFQQIADSLQMSTSELCDYPVIFPIKKPERISSGFGLRYHPINRVWKFHKGIDISATQGTPVYATGNGIVTRMGNCPGYGIYIEIQHAGGFRSFYAPLSWVMVYVGDSVEIARQIACVGNTGTATGSHLHYEVSKGTRFLNPTRWCWLLFEVFKLIFDE